MGARSSSVGRPGHIAEILRRDGTNCVWCARAIDTALVMATVEHVVPRIKGGPSWLENETAACARCNRLRGHQTPADWIEECWRRGWTPDVDRIAALLDGLAAAIDQRGGQRRARPYVAKQRRRLARLLSTQH